jgi:plasmid stabilization system protein ParE
VSGSRADFTPQAKQEIDDAFEWYLERSLHAAQAFLDELEQAFAAIARSPMTWPTYEAGTRRYVLRSFPYSVVYREKPGGVAVIAVCHQKRHPRYWVSRLDRDP